MADANNRTLEQVRTEIEAERKELAGAVGDLRGDLGKAANTAAKLKSKLPFGVVLASGIGAAIRHFARRRRH
jgi:hypothetical protein